MLDKIKNNKFKITINFSMYERNKSTNKRPIKKVQDGMKINNQLVTKPLFLKLKEKWLMQKWWQEESNTIKNYFSDALREMHDDLPEKLNRPVIN